MQTVNETTPSRPEVETTVRYLGIEVDDARRAGRRLNTRAERPRSARPLGELVISGEGMRLVPKSAWGSRAAYRGLPTAGPLWGLQRSEDARRSGLSHVSAGL
jgi:hypothetical protein